MSEKQTENNIDEIFRKGIEPLNTEPSEEFWRKSAESIIQKGNKSTQNKNSGWRIIAFFLAVALLLLGYFTIKMQSGLDKEKQQVAELKKLQNQYPAKATITTIPDSKTIATTQNSGSNTSKERKKIKIIHTKAPGIEWKTAAHVTRKNLNNMQVASAASATKSHYHKPKRDATNIIVAANSGKKQTRVKAENPKSKPAGAEIAQPDLVPSKDSSTTSTFRIKSNQPDATIPIVKATNVAMELKPVTAPISSPLTHPLDSAAIIIPSKFSISAYFSPDVYTGYTFKSSDAEGSQYESAIKSGEKQKFSYTAGVKAEYELSSRFSIGVGLAYQTFSFQIAPSVYYAEKQSDGQVGYSIITSSGIVDCPYYGNPQIGDSLKMNATSSRSYLCVPVQLKYFAIKTNKIKIFLEGGIGINISTGTQTQMNWQDYWQTQGTSIVSTADGLQNMYYSYSFGAGAGYTLSKRVEVYAEPAIQGSITSIDKNTPVVSYPYLLGIAGGLTYHF
jgi:hypothetical protein